MSLILLKDKTSEELRQMVTQREDFLYKPGSRRLPGSPAYEKETLVIGELRKIEKELRRNFRKIS
jgi:hypothetical protein